MSREASTFGGGITLLAGGGGGAGRRGSGISLREGTSSSGCGAPTLPELSQRRAPVSTSQSANSGGQAFKLGAAKDMKRSWLDGASAPPNR